MLAMWSPSIPYPFYGDYVRLRLNWLWREARTRADRHVIFADIVNKGNRANGKVREGGGKGRRDRRGSAACSSYYRITKLTQHLTPLWNFCGKLCY